MPTSADTAILGPFDGATYTLPTFSAAGVAGQLAILGPRPFIDGIILGNGNTLTIGTGGVMTVAPFAMRGGFGSSAAGGTIVLDNLLVNVATGTSFSSGGYQETVGALEIAGFDTHFDIRNGTQLQLVNVANSANYDMTIAGGALVRINAGSRITNGFGENSAAQGRIRFHGGGGLIVQGATGTSSTFDINQVVAASGHSSVRVFSGTGGTVRLNAGNNTIQTGIDRDIRSIAGNFLGEGTGTIEFTFGQDEIPGFTGSSAQVFLRPGGNGVPTQNGVITEGFTGADQSSPYVIMTGSIPGLTGTLGRFASINGTTGEVTAQLGIQRTQSTLSATVANENVIYRPTANATLANSINPQTIVFEPTATNQSIDLNGFTLTTPGIIVERTTTGVTPFNFTLTGGTLAGPGTSLRNIFVLGPSATFFNVSSNFAAGGGIVKSGTGTMVLTGTTPQMDFGGTIHINQGAIRARIDGGSANLGTNNVLALRGGVLEVISNAGASTFTRGLGTAAGQVNWTAGTNYGDRGGGGFAVVTGNLDVNIGGAGGTLVWNGSSGGNEYFLRSGQSLRLGSFQQTGTVTLQNNLALDDGSAGLPFESRQIIVEANSSIVPLFTQRSRITGVISGSASSGLMKIGPAMLELTGANTYAGGTSVDVGALLVSNTSGSGTGTGRVVVHGLLMGNGIIAPSNGNGVTIMQSSTSAPAGLALYRDQFAGTPGHLTIGSAGVNNPVTLRPGSLTIAQLNGTSFDPNGGPTSYSRLTVLGTGAITLTNGNLSVGLNLGFTPINSDVFGILDSQTANALVGAFANGATANAFYIDNSPAGTFQISYVGNITGSTISITGGNDVVLHSFVPVPEPASVLALSAGAVGLVGALRRVRRRVG